MIVVLRLAANLRELWWRALRPRTIGVRGLVVGDEGRVLLVRHSYGRRAWHLPGGGVKRRETLVDALRRELGEEAGVEVTGPVRLLGTYSNVRTGSSDHISVFVVERWTRRDHHDLEISATGFFALDALPDAVTPGTRRRLEEWATAATPAFVW